jgi:uncharacterized protein with GYD domain
VQIDLQIVAALKAILEWRNHMSIYILLMKLTPKGQEKMLEDPDSVLNAANEIRIPDVQTLGLYAVLGEQDFVSIIDAPDNEAAARFSIELGARAGVSVATMPAIPISRLEGADDDWNWVRETETALSVPEDVGFGDDSD